MAGRRRHGALNGARPQTVRQPRHIAGWYFPAPYGIYRTEDGEVAISLADMAVFSEALGLPELAAVTHDEAFERNQALAELIAGAVAGKTTAAWLEIFERQRIWHAPVNDYPAVVADPQVAHNRNFVTLPGATGAPVTLVTHPVRYDGEVPAVRLPPQPLGAQSAEILGELGYSAAEIERLAAAGAIGLPEDA